MMSWWEQHTILPVKVPWNGSQTCNGSQTYSQLQLLTSHTQTTMTASVGTIYKNKYISFYDMFYGINVHISGIFALATTFSR